jgi:aspartyl-tRNA(Asn)/glutamyl-tRNA(Gln) amidotransferase subunit C
MADRVTKEEVLHVAHLARLGLEDDEVASLTEAVGSILDWVSVLLDVDVSDVSEAQSAATPLREDVVQPSLDPEVAVSQAARSEGTAFLVPRVIG